MYTRFSARSFRFNWTAWSSAIIASSSILGQSSIAICDNHNINDNHLTPLLNREVSANELIVQSEDKSDAHLKKFVKPANSFLEWGMHCNHKSPKHNKYFENIHIKTIEFSSNVQLALDVNGNLYCKYYNDEWCKVEKLSKIKDIAITNDMIYVINQKGILLELQYHSLPNKYEDPCIDKHIKMKRQQQSERDIQNCIDHRRKKSFSSMPISDYQKYLKQEYEWNSSHEFSQYLSTQFNENGFESNIKQKKLSKVVANDYRIFAISDNGKVFVRGDNQRGACGISPNDPYIGSFTQINDKYFDSPVVDIAMGEDHTLFVTELGRLFSCGSDNLMQCGLGWTKRKCIQSDTNWTKIGEEGFNFTAQQFDDIKVSEDDKENEYFHEVPSYDEFYPRVLCGPYFDDYKVISIDAGDYHSAAIIEPLYSSLNPLKRHHREIEQMDEAEIVALKKELMENRRVVTWGCGLHGQLGHCNFTNAAEPRPIKPLEQYREFNAATNETVKIKPMSVQCGKEHTVVLMEGEEIEHEDGETRANKMVFAFGNNRYNQVCKKKKPKQAQPYWIQSILPQNVSIDNVAAGNFQSAAFGRADKRQFQF